MVWSFSSGAPGTNRRYSSMRKPIQARVVTVDFARAGMETWCTSLRSLSESHRIVKLDHNALSSLPSSVSLWTDLEHLDLRDNVLSSLPYVVSAWTNLKGLWLGHNALSSLPSSVSTWTNLQILLLNNNELSNLPSCVFAWTKLKILWLVHNALSSLPSSVSAWTNLEELWLQRGRVDANPLVTTARVSHINGLPSLVEISGRTVLLNCV